jgi:imidazolonepropionase-like amidohydrolase
MIQLSKTHFSTSTVAQEYIIKNANLIDVKNGELVKKVSLRIKDGMIAEQLKLSEIPSGIEVFDATGLFMLPGLIDMHVHLVWDGSPNPLTTMKQEGNYLALARGIANAQESLRQGVTTLRDVGSVDDTAIDIAKIFESGLLFGPTIIAAGRIIQPTGGHVPDMGYIADSKEELIKAVRYLKMRGASVIKIASTGGAYGPEEIGPSVYPLEDLEIVVNEAHRLGLNVASHSLGKIGIENAVQAGINTLEHGANTSIEVLKKMKEKNTYLIPTLAVYKKLSESHGQISDIYVEKSKQVVAWHKETFHHAMQIGVPIALGTDAGSPNFGPHPSVFLEMYTMKDYGMSPAAILRAATQTAAEALGKDKLIGTIASGKKADILLLKDNPLEDITKIQTLCQVIKNGVMV